MGCCRARFLILICCLPSFQPWAKHFFPLPFLFFVSCLFRCCWYSLPKEWMTLTWAEHFISFQYPEFRYFENGWVKTFPLLSLWESPCFHLLVISVWNSYTENSFDLYPQKAIIYVTRTKMCGEIHAQQQVDRTLNLFSFVTRPEKRKACLNLTKVRSIWLKIFSFNLKENLWVPFWTSLAETKHSLCSGHVFG